MSDDAMAIWSKDLPRRLATVLASISDIEEVERVLRDVLTESEIVEASARLEAARLLDQNVRYTDIIASTGLSSRTVARVNDWRTNGCGGYSIAIDRLKTTRGVVS